MKKIINGARYDTSTAKCLGGTSHTLPGDFDYWAETLYRTKSGKYFLHGEGGPNSRYAVSASADSWSGGEKITPMAEAEAKQWAEKNLTGDKVEAAFAIPEEDTTAVTAYLPASILAALDARKIKDGCSRTDIITAALKNYLK